MLISSAAVILHERSKRMLIGDGTFPAFVKAVLQQVPSAAMPIEDGPGVYIYGHLIYLQIILTVQRRIVEVMPGDILLFDNVLFKGYKGLHQPYQFQAGTPGEPLVGVVADFDMKRSRVKLYQANQHLGIEVCEMTPPLL
jgi:hypothetical protein